MQTLITPCFLNGLYMGLCYSATSGNSVKSNFNKYLSENIFFHFIVLCRVIFFSLATPDIFMAFLLLLTDADSEKLLERLSVILKSFVPIKQLIRP